MCSVLDLVQLHESAVQLLRHVRLRDAETRHGGDVGGALLVHGRVLAAHAARLQSVLLGLLLQLLLAGALLGDVRELAEDRLALTSAHVSGTCSDHAIYRVLCKSDAALLDFGEQLVE